MPQGTKYARGGGGSRGTGHKTVSCEHSGKGDVDRHCDPKLDTHNKNVNAIKVSSKLQFSKKSSSNTFDVSKPELLHVNLIVQHNLPFSLTDHLSKIYPVMFPHSKIAKGFSYARTKTTKTFKRSHVARTEVVCCVSDESGKPYSLVNDGKSDTSLKKDECGLCVDI